MLVALALVVACLGGIAGYRRFAGGTHLVVLNGNEVSGSMRVGMPVSTGIPMWTEGGPSVDLQSVADDHSPNVTVRYSLIRRGPRGDGIGFVDGPIAAWDPIAISGARVSQPARKLVETTCTTGSSTVVSACAPVASRDADPGSTSPRRHRGGDGARPVARHQLSGELFVVVSESHGSVEFRHAWRRNGTVGLAGASTAERRDLWRPKPASQRAENLRW